MGLVVRQSLVELRAVLYSVCVCGKLNSLKQLRLYKTFRKLLVEISMLCKAINVLPATKCVGSRSASQFFSRNDYKLFQFDCAECFTFLLARCTCRQCLGKLSRF